MYSDMVIEGEVGSFDIDIANWDTTQTYSFSYEWDVKLMLEGIDESKITATVDNKTVTVTAVDSEWYKGYCRVLKVL